MGPIFFNILLACLTAWIAWHVFNKQKKFKWVIALALPLALPLAIYSPIWLNARAQQDASDAWAALIAIVGIIFCYIGSAGGVLSALIANKYKASENV